MCRFFLEICQRLKKILASAKQTTVRVGVNSKNYKKLGNFNFVLRIMKKCIKGFKVDGLCKGSLITDFQSLN